MSRIQGSNYMVRPMFSRY